MGSNAIYPLVMTNIAMEAMAIGITSFPIKTCDFPVRYVTNCHRVSMDDDLTHLNDQNESEGFTITLHQTI